MHRYPELKKAGPATLDVLIEVLEELIILHLSQEQGWTEAGSELLNELLGQLKEAKRACRPPGSSMGKRANKWLPDDDECLELLRASKGTGDSDSGVQSTLGEHQPRRGGNWNFFRPNGCPSDWEREALAFTQVPDRAGGPRLEAMYLACSVNTNDDSTYAPLSPELLVYTQSSQFANIVTDTTSFTATYQNQRVLMYDAAQPASTLYRPVIGGVTWQMATSKWHLKSKQPPRGHRGQRRREALGGRLMFTGSFGPDCFPAYLSLP